MSLQLYKELYAEESQRREQLQTSAGTPISIVTILGGGLLLMGKAFENSHPAVYVPFWIAFAAALCCLTVVVFCIVRSIHGYVYKRIPYASELTIHQANLQGLHASAGKPECAQTAFEGYLIKKYVVATGFNAVNNVNRAEWLNRANRWLVYALCTTALAGVQRLYRLRRRPKRRRRSRSPISGAPRMSKAKPSSAHPASDEPSAPHPQPAASGRSLIPPEGPPNIKMRTGMKLPEAYWQLLEEDSPHRSSGDGPAPPVGPPNIELRNGVTMHPMHHLSEEILLDDLLGAGPTPPEGPPNIKLGTGPDFLRKLVDLLSAVFRTRPVER